MTRTFHPRRHLFILWGVACDHNGGGPGLHLSRAAAQARADRLTARVADVVARREVAA